MKSKLQPEVMDTKCLQHPKALFFQGHNLVITKEFDRKNKLKKESESENIGGKSKNDDGRHDNQENDKHIDGTLLEALPYIFPLLHCLN